MADQSFKTGDGERRGAKSGDRRVKAEAAYPGPERRQGDRRRDSDSARR